MLREVPACLDEGRTDLLIQFIVATAAQEDEWRSRELGPIHLLKYTYLADLVYAERHEGNSFTGATWQFYHFGPWQPEVFERIEPALAAIHAKAKKIPSRYEGDFVRYSMAHEDARAVKARAERDLPVGVVGTIQHAVREFGSDTASLLRHTYLTYPMLHAAPGENLIFAREARETYAASMSAAASPSRSQQRRRAEALKALKERVKQRLGERQKRPDVYPPPRYDAVYDEGSAWLDSLAGEPLRQTEGEVTVHPDVWKSPQRTEPDVP